MDKATTGGDCTTPPVIECLTTPAEVRAYGAAWGNLLVRDPHATAYQGLPWLLTWMTRHPAARPMILIARRGARVTAALPLCAHPVGLPAGGPYVLRFLADNDCDYCAALSDPDLPDDLAALWATLIERGAWSLLDLRYLIAGSPLAAVAQAARPDLLIDRQQQDTAPYLDIGVDWRLSVSGNHRSQVLRRLRQLRAEGAVTFDVARSADEVDEILQQLSKMHITRWRRRHETSVFVVPQERAWLHAACQALHRQSQLYLCRVSLDDAPVAIGLYCLARRRLTNYMVSFDEAYRRFGPVHLMVMMAIEDTRARGLADVHDFGRGSEEYKLRWTRTSQPVARVLVARRSPAGRAAFWWATRAQPLIWEHYRAATLLREIRRRLRARKSQGRAADP